jgi:hypothetical protein
METLKVFSVLFLLAGAYLFVGDDDYHKKFDKQELIRYNCNSLKYSEMPKEVFEKCITSEREYIYVKTY